MFRIAIATLAIGLQAACVMLPLPGYGGVIYLPRGKVELPREASLEACAAAVRSAAASDDPAVLGQFVALPSSMDLTGNVLGVCSGPGGARHLVLPNDVQPGLQLFTAP